MGALSLAFCLLLLPSVSGRLRTESQLCYLKHLYKIAMAIEVPKWILEIFWAIGAPKDLTF